MTRYDRRTQALASCLAALAGFVDAVGFLTLGGFFASFMSGNSTRFALGLTERSHAAVAAAAIISVFVLGVIVGSLSGRIFHRHRRAKLICFVAGLLALAALLAALDLPTAAMAVAIMAMGAENAVFEHDGDIQIGLTYMTGALVKAGQRVASALVGGDKLGWVPYLCLWGSLTSGAVVGSLAHGQIGLASLWCGALSAFLLAYVALKIDDADQSSR